MANKYFKVEGRVFRLGESTIKGAGRGLFATSDICRGEVLGQYQGRIYGPEKLFSAPTQVYIYENKAKQQIMPDLEKCPFAFMNDIVDVQTSLLCKEVVEYADKSHNVEWREKGRKEGCLPVILAIADIRKGDELFISYGHEYWEFRLRSKRFRRGVFVEGDALQKHFVQKIRLSGDRSGEGND